MFRSLVEEQAAEVCKSWRPYGVNVKPSALFGRSRKPLLTRLRADVARRCIATGFMGVRDVADVFERDHATVCYWIATWPPEEDEA